MTAEKIRDVEYEPMSARYPDHVLHSVDGTLRSAFELIAPNGLSRNAVITVLGVEDDRGLHYLPILAPAKDFLGDYGTRVSYEIFRTGSSTRKEVLERVYLHKEHALENGDVVEAVHLRNLVRQVDAYLDEDHRHIEPEVLGALEKFVRK